MLIKFNYIIELQKKIFNLCNFQFSNLIAETESSDYCAHYCHLDNKHIRFRVAKRTPIKSGSFVAIYKRVDGVIKPYDQYDDVDFFIINCICGTKVGQFVFPKQVLIEKKIFSKDNVGGKRAIRVYSPWDKISNIQGIKTKNWQIKYFVNITEINSTSIDIIKKLYSFTQFL